MLLVTSAMEVTNNRRGWRDLTISPGGGGGINNSWREGWNNERH
jgi:hypothetical protein